MPWSRSTPSTQRAHATYLVKQRKVHYLLSVKSNQPKLAGQLSRLPWKRAPVMDRSRDRGHGREEIREPQVVTVDGLLFPHARQVMRIRRKRRRTGTRKWSTETVYAVTDLEAHEASPAEPAAWSRGHRIIENKIHWVKDVTFAEDASQVRRHRTPAVMSSLATSPGQPPTEPAGPTSPTGDALTPARRTSSPFTATHDQKRTFRILPVALA
ncbi:ISAs1 family transposase [Streptomyces bottropensis]